MLLLMSIPSWLTLCAGSIYQSNCDWGGYVMDIPIFLFLKVSITLLTTFTLGLLLKTDIYLRIHHAWALCVEYFFLFPYLTRECLEHVGNALGTPISSLQVASKDCKVLRLALTIILVNREPIYIRIFLGYWNSIARILTNYFWALQLLRLFKDHM